jgi:hypothetical protein
MVTGKDLLLSGEPEGPIDPQEQRLHHGIVVKVRPVRHLLFIGFVVNCADAGVIACLGPGIALACVQMGVSWWTMMHGAAQCRFSMQARDVAIRGMGDLVRRVTGNRNTART